MNNDELNKIIQRLENDNPKDKAFFGVHYINGGEDLHIKANRYGLELFANELLKASRDSNSIFVNPDKSLINIDYEEKWIKGDIWIVNIEPKTEDRVDLIEESNKRTWKDKAVEKGCFLIIGIAILIFIVGIYTVFSWI
jgi:hypothetical protein